MKSQASIIKGLYQTYIYNLISINKGQFVIKKDIPETQHNSNVLNKINIIRPCAKNNDQIICDHNKLIIPESIFTEKSDSIFKL